jgi:hypothetical protein
MFNCQKVKPNSDNNEHAISENNQQTIQKKWNFSGTYVIISIENKSILDEVELKVQDNKITGKGGITVNPDNIKYWTEITGTISENNIFNFSYGYGCTEYGEKWLNDFTPDPINGQIFSKDYIEGISYNTPIIILSKASINNYPETKSNQNTTSSGTFYNDTKEFTTSTAKAVKLGWEIMNNPVGAAERMVNDEEYSRNLEKTTEDMLNSAERMNERLENASTKIQNLLKK